MSDNSQTVIVTGASSGIGLGVAHAYLDRGANVVLNSRNAAKLEAAAQQLARPDQVALVPGDVWLKKTTQQLVDQAIKRFGRLDVLVNTAGAEWPRNFSDVDDREAFYEMDVTAFTSGFLSVDFFLVVPYHSFDGHFILPVPGVQGSDWAKEDEYNITDTHGGIAVGRIQALLVKATGIDLPHIPAANPPTQPD